MWYEDDKYVWLHIVSGWYATRCGNHGVAGLLSASHTYRHLLVLSTNLNRLLHRDNGDA